MNTSVQQEIGMVIRIPASNGGPLVAAFGLTLSFAGLLTHFMVSILGAITLCGGLIAWFREVLPHEAHEAVTPEREGLPVAQPKPKVRHLEVGELGHRARLPLQIYPYSAGFRGGLVGGVAMAALAILYGLIGHRSIWYPINLLAAAGSAQISAMSYKQLLEFSATGLVLATIIHVAGSALVGLLYGMTLPMFPRRPMLLGGVLGPLFWSGILSAEMGIVNPLLQQRIDWKWFMASQFAFGLVAGFVVAKHERISTMQHLSFAERAGIEGPGISEEKEDGESGS
ncbi:MAG TPA: hypothetical protein VK731_08950 [Candidatus Cybelea sp.]|jgi:hypothetical protein|nr:hypothetical protein [Candidatus Cybelea sp.]